MTPERLLLAAIVKAMSDRRGAEVLRSLSPSDEIGMEERALHAIAIDIACGCFAPFKPTGLH